MMKSRILLRLNMKIFTDPAFYGPFVPSGLLLICQVNVTIIKFRERPFMCFNSMYLNNSFAIFLLLFAYLESSTVKRKSPA